MDISMKIYFLALYFLYTAFSAGVRKLHLPVSKNVTL